MAKKKTKKSGKPNNAVAKHLSVLLADSYVLLLKTQNYHWNVTGPYFNTLHTMFQTQYEDLFAAVDLTAERLRAIGVKAPGSFSAFAKLSSIKDETGAPSAMQMIKNLAKDQEVIIKSAQALVDAADDADDEATEDLGIERLQVHQKNLWMLKAHLE